MQQTVCPLPNQTSILRLHYLPQSRFHTLGKSSWSPHEEKEKTKRQIMLIIKGKYLFSIISISSKVIHHFRIDHPNRPPPSRS